MSPFQDPNFLKALLLILLVAAIIDWRTFKIPNLVTIPAAVGALTYYTGMHGFSGLLFSLAGLGIGLLLLLIPYLMGGLGGGDVKLMGVVGAFLGAKAVIIAFLFSAIIGGLYALSLIVIHRDCFRGFFKNQRDTLYNFLLTRKITPGSNTLCADRPRLKYGLAISFGTGLFIIAQINGLTFL